MHYEILKWLDWKDLLILRGVRSGGYQMATNENLRGIIKNYMNICCPIIEHNNIVSDLRKIHLLFQQLGRKYLKFTGDNCEKEKLKYLLGLCQYIDTITELELGIYIYIYTYIF